MNDLAKKILDYLNSAEGFIQSQMPDFANQFIAYHTWSAQYWFWITVIFLGIMIIAQIITTILLSFSKLDDGQIFAFLVVGAIGTASLFMCAGAYMDLKKLEIAPKVYMIEQAKKLVINGGGK